MYAKRGLVNQAQWFRMELSVSFPLRYHGNENGACRNSAALSTELHALYRTLNTAP